MSNHAPDGGLLSAAVMLDRLDRLIVTAIERLTLRRTLVLAVLLTIAVMFMYRPFSQPEVGDSAIYDYIAQSILRGQLPYRDVIEIKAPGSFYLSALAMKAGRAVGVRDIIAVRLLYILLMGFLSGVVFLVAGIYLRNRFAAVLATLFLLTSQSLALWTLGGEPKLPMILLGMLTLLLITKDRPIWAGVCSMSACLCWQPGLLFTGVAFLMFSRYLTSWRDLRAVRVLAGSAIPLAVLLFYFRWKGALGDLWTWTVVFNYSVYARNAIGAEANSFVHALGLTLRIFGVDLVLVVFSLIGFVWFGIRRVRERLRRGAFQSPDLYRDAIIIVPVVYFAACIIRFNAGPYLLPFFPFLGIFFGWFVVEMLRLLKSNERRANVFNPRNVTWLARAAFVVLLGLISYRVLEYRLFEYILPLRIQDESFEAVSSRLSESDTIYVHGTTELLVLLNRPNLNPYIFLDWGKDDFIAARKYGGSFEGLVDEIRASAPKVIALTRLQRVVHRAELKELVENYDRLDLKGGYEIYVRRQQ